MMVGFFAWERVGGFWSAGATGMGVFLAGGFLVFIIGFLIGFFAAVFVAVFAAGFATRANGVLLAETGGGETVL